MPFSLPVSSIWALANFDRARAISIMSAISLMVDKRDTPPGAKLRHPRPDLDRLGSVRHGRRRLKLRQDRFQGRQPRCQQKRIRYAEHVGKTTARRAALLRADMTLFRNIGELVPNLLPVL